MIISRFLSPNFHGNRRWPTVLFRFVTGERARKIEICTRRKSWRNPQVPSFITTCVRTQYRQHLRTYSIHMEIG